MLKKKINIFLNESVKTGIWLFVQVNNNYNGSVGTKSIFLNIIFIKFHFVLLWFWLIWNKKIHELYRLILIWTIYSIFKHQLLSWMILTGYIYSVHCSLFNWIFIYYNLFYFFFIFLFFCIIVCKLYTIGRLQPK